MLDPRDLVREQPQVERLRAEHLTQPRVRDDRVQVLLERLPGERQVERVLVLAALLQGEPRELVAHPLAVGEEAVDRRALVRPLGVRGLAKALQAAGVGEATPAADDLDRRVGGEGDHVQAVPDPEVLEELAHGSARRGRAHVVEPDVEHRFLARELLQVSAGDRVLLEHHHLASGLREQDRVDEARDPGSDDDDVGH